MIPRALTWVGSGHTKSQGLWLLKHEPTVTDKHAVTMTRPPQPSRMRLMSFISSADMGFRLNPFSSGLPEKTHWKNQDFVTKEVKHFMINSKGAVGRAGTALGAEVGSP